MHTVQSIKRGLILQISFSSKIIKNQEHWAQDNIGCIKNMSWKKLFNLFSFLLESVEVQLGSTELILGEL